MLLSPYPHLPTIIWSNTLGKGKLEEALFPSIKAACRTKCQEYFLCCNPHLNSYLPLSSNKDHFFQEDISDALLKLTIGCSDDTCHLLLALLCPNPPMSLLRTQRARTVPYPLSVLPPTPQEWYKLGTQYILTGKIQGPHKVYYSNSRHMCTSESPQSAQALCYLLLTLVIQEQGFRKSNMILLGTLQHVNNIKLGLEVLGQIKRPSFQVYLRPVL